MRSRLAIRLFSIQWATSFRIRIRAAFSVNSSRQRILGRPHRRNMARAKLRDLIAVPAKDSLRNKARVCPPLVAVCEIVDNVFDNFDENRARRDLLISFTIKTDDPSSIRIVENSGGVREEKLEPLVRLGVPSHFAP